MAATGSIFGIEFKWRVQGEAPPRTREKTRSPEQHSIESSHELAMNPLWLCKICDQADRGNSGSGIDKCLFQKQDTMQVCRGIEVVKE